MAKRPVFVPRKSKPYVNVFCPEFEWNAGLSAAQKKRNVAVLHSIDLPIWRRGNTLCA